VQAEVQEKPKFPFEIERPLPNVRGLGKAYLGNDLRLYRRTTGLLELLCPVNPVEGSEPHYEVEGIHWDGYIVPGHMKWLWESFLAKYDTEVVVILGRKYDTGEFFAMVPWQHVAVNRVAWNDKAGMEWMDEFGEYLGTMHIHPGNCAEPSSLDIGHWVDKDSSGLHVIVGRDGDYTISGSAAGKCYILTRGNLQEYEAKELEVLTSKNRVLTDLLIPFPEPKKQKKHKRHKGGREADRGAQFGWIRGEDQPITLTEWLNLFGGEFPSVDDFVFVEGAEVIIPLELWENSEFTRKFFMGMKATPLSLGKEVSFES